VNHGMYWFTNCAARCDPRNTSSSWLISWRARRPGSPLGKCIRALRSSAEPSSQVDSEKLRTEMSMDERLEVDMKVKGLVGENTSVCVRVTSIEIVRTFNSRSNLNRFQIELETVSNYTTLTTESCISVTADIVYYPLLHILALYPAHFLRKPISMSSGRPTRAHAHTPP